MISVNELEVHYRKREAISHFSLEVEQGQVFALLGRNGSGKSSLLKILLGQRRRDCGRATVLGRDPWCDRTALMHQLGATPETPDAPPAMNVRALERFVAAVHRNWNSELFAGRLRRFGIDPKIRFGDLSRGQKSLVHLALALGHSPELLLLDDPTLGLDPVARRYFFEELVTDLADRGTTVLLATQDIDGASRVATHVGILNGGRLVANGTAEDVCAGLPLEERFVALVGDERSAA